MANMTKTEKLDLEPRRRKKKEDCNGIYIISRKMRVKSKRRAKEQIEEPVKDKQKLWRRMMANRSRLYLDSPQMGNLISFPDKTEISAFGFARLKCIRLVPFGSIQTVLYKFHKYIGIYFSTLKAPFCNKIPPFFNNNYNKINSIIIVNIYLQRIYHLSA